MRSPKGRLCDGLESLTFSSVRPSLLRLRLAPRYARLFARLSQRALFPTSALRRSKVPSITPNTQSSGQTPYWLRQRGAARRLALQSVHDATTDRVWCLRYMAARDTTQSPAQPSTWCYIKPNLLDQISYYSIHHFRRLRLITRPVALFFR